MAEPANIDTSTPDPAVAEGQVDRQKALLNDLIAMEGQNGRQIYERQGPDAQKLLQARLGDAGQMPEARKAVYDAFMRDQVAAEGQHTRQLQRQSELNSQFMDAARAAVPIHSKNVDAAIDALRLQFEERQRREAEAAAERAASRASASARQGTGNKLIDAQIAQDEYNAWLMAQGRAPQGTSRKLADVEAAGAAGSRLDPATAAQALGLNYETFFGPQIDQADLGVFNGQMMDDIKKSKGDMSFDEFMANATDFADSIGFAPEVFQLILGSYAPVWGLKPSDVVNDASFANIRAASKSMGTGSSGAPGQGNSTSAQVAPSSGIPSNWTRTSGGLGPGQY